LLESITILPYDPADARETGAIRAALESESSRVANLRCVDWRDRSGRAP
jgi:predicted nucleic acid-binding protein